MKYRHILRFIVFFLLIAFSSYGQKNIYFGPELQIYPTGILPGVRIEFPTSQKTSIHLRAAAQLINHRNLGKHDSEKGRGYGLSAGYRYAFSDLLHGSSLSLRADWWHNTIDWENKPDAGIQKSGTTTIDVFQPTLVYEYVINAGSITFIPSLSTGIEWNVKTSGEPTGEGAIVLLGACLMF